MIVTTKACDALVKGMLPPAERKFVAVSSIKEISQKIKLDPNVGGQTIDAFIISSSDVRNPKIAMLLKDGLAGKHPDAKVIFISKDNKPSEFSNSYPGIAKSLIKPKTDDLRTAVYSLAAELSAKPVVPSAKDKAAELNPKEQNITAKDLIDQSMMSYDDDDTEVPYDYTSPTVPLPMPAVSLEEPEEAFFNRNEESELVTRIKAAGSLANMRDIAKELSAGKILTDLAKENAQYDSIEKTLKGLYEQIYAITVDTAMGNREKAEKIRSLVYSKHYYDAQCDTIIEQYLKQIIETLAGHCADLNDKMLAELQNKMKIVATYGDGQADFSRLGGINEERGNIILELSLMEKELADISTKVSDAVTELVENRLATATDNTSSPLLNNILKVQGSYIVSAESITTMGNILRLAESGNEEFYEMSRKVNDTITKINSLLNLDKQTIAAQAEIIKYLQSANLEDTIVANTLLKKTLRVFTGAEGVGRSIVPYLLSKYKSRENKNVMFIDLTGTSKLEAYGIQSHTLDDYRANRYMEDFCVVTGEVATIEQAQTMIGLLTKAADYYAVINVVVDPDNKSVFDILSSDVRVINFVTDTKLPHMNKTKELLETYNYDNVARRVICNNISVPISSIAKYFGLLDDPSIQLLSVEHVPQIENCLFDRRDPYNIDAVIEAYKEVRKYA